MYANLLFCSSHEDGSVRFWDVSSVSISLLYKLTTADLFGGYSGRGDGYDSDGDEEWPPFRKVVHKIALDSVHKFMYTLKFHTRLGFCPLLIWTHCWLNPAKL